MKSWQLLTLVGVFGALIALLALQELASAGLPVLDLIR